MDRLSVRLTALLPRGWLLAGLASLLPAFFSGAPAESLAIGVGGVLFAHGALRRLAGGLGQLAGVVISWRQIAPLFHAATAIPRSETTRADDIAAAKAVVEAGSLSFRHRPAGRAVFEGLDLKIARGDRVLLEGESGGGKSTLVSLLAGLREPSSGVLLSGGMDRASIGEKNWRRRVAVAPQYHENHVLTGSLLFNVLMSRPWPPSQEDVEEAERVCRELGLGPLLERMPAGVMEMVGETGWQLSQGERSRLFLARALLQRSELVVLDESFAALDPESLQKSLECALRRAPTLMVVAHP
jgi:ATP-binding cassette subfamily B protein